MRLIFLAALSTVATAVQAANANLGRDISANCLSCHSGAPAADGVSIASLVGLDKGKIVTAMRDFREGRRPSTVMGQLAKGYTAAQIDAAAEYLATLKRR